VIAERGQKDSQATDGRPDLRRFYVPVEDCDILGTWDVSAMAATGSFDMGLNDVFVPEHRQIKIASVLARTSPGLALNEGPLWRVAFITFASLGAVGSMIGAPRRCSIWWPKS
jgi:3-hydroxy-9,10-secoandrosta-1,3,5(10)-triene-9,17-dione monooxygenase